MCWFNTFKLKPRFMYFFYKPATLANQSHPAIFSLGWTLPDTDLWDRVRSQSTHEVPGAGSGPN